MSSGHHKFQYLVRVLQHDKGPLFAIRELSGGRKYHYIVNPTTFQCVRARVSVLATSDHSIPNEHGILYPSALGSTIRASIFLRCPCCPGIRIRRLSVSLYPAFAVNFLFERHWAKFYNEPVRSGMDHIYHR